MKNGSVTVFFSLIFTVVLALICTVIESARIYASGVYAKSLTYMAMESEFAGYSRQAFDDYGVLLLWQKNDMEEELQKYVDANNLMADINTGDSKFDMLQLKLSSLNLKNVTYATDNGGDEFVKQVLNYEKYEMLGDAAEKLINYYKSYDDDEVKKIINSDAIEDYENISSDAEGGLYDMIHKFEVCIQRIKKGELEKTYESLKKKINKICSLENSNPLNNREIKSMIKYFKRLEKELTNFNEDVEEALTISGEYEEIKEQVIQKYGTEDNNEGVKESIESNSTNLKKMHRMIDKVRNEQISIGIAEMNSGNITDKKEVTKVYLMPMDDAINSIVNEIQNLRVREVSSKDEKGRNIFEAAKDFMDTGIMELVTPENYKISNAVISSSGLPSNHCEEGIEKPLDNLLNKAIFVQYIDNNFENGKEINQDNCLQYEMEYIIAGNLSDKENLSDTVIQLVGMRQIFNTAYILTDSEKMSLCSSMAMGAAAAIGLPFIEPVIKVILIQAWALAESVTDIKDLLKGGGVPLVKQKKNWRTSLTNLTGEGINNSEVSLKKEESKGFGYETYLKILLMTKNSEKIIYRVMDLIQLNVNKHYNQSFRVEQCIISASVDMKYGTDCIFTSIPFVNNILNRKNEIYEFYMNAEYGYVN